jgi:hypothetical protein
MARLLSLPGKLADPSYRQQRERLKDGLRKAGMPCRNSSTGQCGDDAIAEGRCDDPPDRKRRDGQAGNAVQTEIPLMKSRRRIAFPKA